MHPFKNRILKSCLLLFFLAFAGNTFYGQTTDNAIDRQIDRLFSNYGSTTPGVAVAVVQDGKIIFKKGYGAANLEYDIPITTKTVFQIASVSKQFTAFSIYLLEKQAKISLEDDIRKYVPEVPDFGKTIKIKHLLAHTGGVKDQWALLALAGWRMDDVITTQHILKLASKQKELNFEPGSRYLYSNSGYTLLAEIVKRVSGQSFAEFTKKNIFEPLGMTDTQFYNDYERIVKNRADSYELENGAYKKKNLSNSADGASNLYTTVEDLAKWVLNFENPKVGDAELIKRFNEPSLLNNGERVVYGISDGEPGYHAKGQIHWNYRGLHLMSHGGHAAAFRSFLGRFPDKNLAVIALSNDEHYQNFNTSIKIAEFYLKDDLKPNQITNTPASPNKTARKPNANLKDFEGKFYNDELEAFYSAKFAGEKLILSHIRHGDIELTEIGEDKFSGRIEFPVEVEFVRDKNGVVTGFKISNFGAKNVKFARASNPN
ncbi:MAG TPA: serine hydrolase domain-containing protein [Pyrinomonadaceae bacterium]|jgi:CubicO group peptidase (beta-lactamase class C family)